MKKIKTYPLQFTEDDLNDIKIKAESKDMSIKEFIYEAIKEKMERD